VLPPSRQARRRTRWDFVTHCFTSIASLAFCFAGFAVTRLDPTSLDWLRRATPCLARPCRPCRAKQCVDEPGQDWFCTALTGSAERRPASLAQIRPTVTCTADDETSEDWPRLAGLAQPSPVLQDRAQTRQAQPSRASPALPRLAGRCRAKPCIADRAMPALPKLSGGQPSLGVRLLRCFAGFANAFAGRANECAYVKQFLISALK